MDAIMQIHGVRVGQSVRPDEHPSLDSLQEEFALAINGKSALTGRFFIHTAAPKAGRTWCITENSAVPEGLRYTSTARPYSMVTKSADGSIHVVAAVHACGFQDFYTVIKPTEAQWSLYIYLDYQTRQLLDPEDTIKLDEDDLCVWGPLLIQRFEAIGLTVMLLGNPKFTHEDRRSSVSWSQEHYGLLLAPTVPTDEPGTTVTYDRLGVCKWKMLRTSPADFTQAHGGIPEEVSKLLEGESYSLERDVSRS